MRVSLFNIMSLPIPDSLTHETFIHPYNRKALHKALISCRQETLSLVADICSDTLTTQSHPDFSPIGWHIGHIAYTESLWILEKLAGQSCSSSEHIRLFSADGLPKKERQNLPELKILLKYIKQIRSVVLTYLNQINSADLSVQAPLWYWLLQHESQHAETISIVLALHQLQKHQPQSTTDFLQPIPIKSPVPSTKCLLSEPLADMVQVSAGDFTQGSNSPTALDNEQPAHSVSLPSYWIDRRPVNCGQYRQFIEAGGYEQKQWWTQAGWQWQQSQGIHQPLYWHNFQGASEETEALIENHPVCGVSWYEAAAYARFVGKRLPTEAEWAKAASWDVTAQRSRPYPWGESLDIQCNYGRRVGGTTHVDQFEQYKSPYGCEDMLGNVWEWTDTWFAPYPDFNPFPYAGYSQTYFDQAHRVLRGGSWATPRWVLRNSFRNWYHPHRREVFAGFRCAL